MSEQGPDRSSIPKMLASDLREVGLLVVVFGLIEGALGWEHLVRDWHFTGWGYVARVVLIGGGAVAAGYVVERKRKQ